MASSIYPASEDAADATMHDGPASTHHQTHPSSSTGGSHVYSNPYESGYLAQPTPSFAFGGRDEIERPMSTGKVAKHKAGESIHYSSREGKVGVLEGSKAEVVNLDRRSRGNSGNWPNHSGSWGI